jgi:hypothetical protein
MKQTSKRQAWPASRTGFVILIFLWLVHLPAFADHVHHLWYNNTFWQDQDLTALTNGGIATSSGAIAAFYTTPNHQFHVYYVDSNSQHVHQLFHSTHWSDEDLTAFTGGPTAYAYGITGFAIGNLQYVFYVGTDLHVHQLSYNNVNWTDQDLTSLVGGNSASPAPLVAFATKPNNQFHVYYQDVSTLHEYQLYFNGSSWSYQDLSALVGGPYCYTQWIAGLAVGNQQHLFCAGFFFSNRLDLLHIYYTSAWQVEDVSLLAAGYGSPTPMYLNGGIAAFKNPAFPSLEVYSVTNDTHFNRYVHDSGSPWADWDLTNLYGAPTDAHFGGTVAFATTGNNQFHIYYAPSTEVYQVYFNGTSWSVEDLTGGRGQADPNSGMAGFALGNLQHVFYMSPRN